MLEPLFKKVKSDKANPFEYSAERSNGIRLSTYGMSDGKRHLSTLKLGEELVKKAQLTSGDMVQLWKDGDEWLLKVDPNGKALVKAPNSKGSLLLRFIWREGFPAIAESAFCQKVRIDRPAKGIRFTFPEGTKFDAVPKKVEAKKEKIEKKAKSAQNAEPLFHDKRTGKKDPLYESHRAQIERSGAADLFTESERRQGGRRAEDRKNH